MLTYQWKRVSTASLWRTLKFCSTVAFWDSLVQVATLVLAALTFTQSKFVTLASMHV